jgi:hypothetical protein
LVALLAPIPRDDRDGRLHGGPDPLGLLEAIDARLAEPCLVGAGAARGERGVDIPGNALAVATPPTLQGDKVVRVADGAHTLGNRLALPQEVLTRLASRCHLLGGWRKPRDHLGRAAGATPRRWPTGPLGVRLPMGARRCSRGHRLVGGTLWGGERCRDRLAQRRRPMEEVRGVRPPQMVFTISEKP